MTTCSILRSGQKANRRRARRCLPAGCSRPGPRQGAPAASEMGKPTQTPSVKTATRGVRGVVLFANLAVETGMSTKMLTGSFVALITPFNKDGSVDFAAFRTLLKFQEDQRHVRGADHGLDRRDLDALAGGEKADHRRDREDEDAAHADLLRLHRQQHRGDDRQCPLRQGQRRRRRDPGRARLYLRAGRATSSASSSTWPTRPTCRSASTTTRRG